jgi:exodeoxyribonuclease-3
LAPSGQVGQGARVKIATWNINSVRARLDRLLEWLDEAQPDALCLQETKCTDDAFPLLELSARGYQAQLFGQKTYNGVALISKGPVAHVSRNLSDGDEQARVIGATVNGVNVIGVYAPNGQAVDSPAYAYKLEWYARLRRWLRQAYPEGPVVLCGDFNVAPTPLDVWDPSLWEGQLLCTERERAAWRELCAVNGLVDLQRARHAEGGLFSWWDYRASGFKKNQGARIDHLLVSSELVARCTAVEVDRVARGKPQPSDHAPVWATFTV